MYSWENGQHRILSEDTVRTCKQYLGVASREDIEEKRARTHTSLVLHGMLRSAVQWILDREQGGVFQPGDTCTKTGETVLQVLH